MENNRIERAREEIDRAIGVVDKQQWDIHEQLNSISVALDDIDEWREEGSDEDRLNEIQQKLEGLESNAEGPVKTRIERAREYIAESRR